MDIVSLFAGCGGLDLGFRRVGFKVKWANEFDKSIWETYEHNHKDTYLDKRSILDVPSVDIPACIGIIGGPPCQSWSEAGAGRGINDSRGKLFYEYIRIIRDKRPLFFLAENVSGILEPKHSSAFNNILKEFSEAGYNVKYKLLNAGAFNVPQSRNRIIIVGYQKIMEKVFDFPKPQEKMVTLRDAIWSMPQPKPAMRQNIANEESTLNILNHEYMIGGFSTIYMSRNRVRSWDEQSFTIQAGGRHAPIHPQAPKMLFVEKDKRIFVPGKEKLYRRLSVRECARIQTFPDNFIFKYDMIADGYKMVGNAVPVKFAETIAKKIYLDLIDFFASRKDKANIGAWTALAHKSAAESWQKSKERIPVLN